MLVWLAERLLAIADAQEISLAEAVDKAKGKRAES
jgi:hypothetical protein